MIQVSLTATSANLATAATLKVNFAHAVTGVSPFTAVAIKVNDVAHAITSARRVAAVAINVDGVGHLIRRASNTGKGANLKIEKLEREGQIG